MTEEKQIDLYDFVHRYLERAGALVEKPGYALLEAMLPQEAAQLLGEEYLTAAFDYEIARENEASTFITYGSPLLDAMVSAARDYGRFCRLYWPGSSFTPPSNLEKRLSDAITFSECRSPKIEMVLSMEMVFWSFFFRASFSSFEKIEQVFSITLDGVTGLPSPNFEDCWQRIVPVESPSYQLPTAEGMLDLSRLYQAACKHIEPVIEARATDFRQTATRLKDRELDRMRMYYEESSREIQHKMKTSLDPARLDRLQKQLSALDSDRRRREDDTHERYAVEAELELDYLLACHVPCARVSITLQNRNRFINHNLTYNPVIEAFEAPACAQCGLPSRILVPNNDGNLVCPTHR